MDAVSVCKTLCQVVINRATDKTLVIRQMVVEEKNSGARGCSGNFGYYSHMRSGNRSLVWPWASVTVIGGIAMLVAVDLIEDPDSTLFDVALNLLEEAPLVLITVGVVILYQTIQRHRDENHQIVQDLEVARIEGRHWRSQAQAHLKGLGEAVSAQFSQWKLTTAEREVALLLLKGLSSKEISTIRTTSERTVREQARSIYQKAGLNGRAALSAYFLEDLLAPTDTLN